VAPIATPPWWATLQTLDDPSLWLGVAIDLAPTPRLADRQIAQRIARSRDRRGIEARRAGLPDTAVGSMAKSLDKR
jgi:hypothetical protein